MTDKTLLDKVSTSLDNALENGYDMIDMPPEEVTADLIAYDSDLENSNPDEIVSCVIQWQEKKNSEK